MWEDEEMKKEISKTGMDGLKLSVKTNKGEEGYILAEDFAKAIYQTILEAEEESEGDKLT